VEDVQNHFRKLFYKVNSTTKWFGRGILAVFLLWLYVLTYGRDVLKSRIKSLRLP